MSDLDRIKLGINWGTILSKSNVRSWGQVSKQVGHEKYDKILKG